ncbi:MAG TPA: histidine kinase, partial [Chitinophagaceae bacterium]|nr:histidine kinase [Chitinophagaceae bacterium]
MTLNNKYRLLFHCLGIILFLSIPLAFPSYSSTFRGKELASYTSALIFFYINYYYLVPTFYFNRKFTHYIIILLLSFIIITFLPLFVITEQHSTDIVEWRKIHNLDGFLAPYYSDIKRNIMLFATAVFASIAFRINDHLKQLNKEKINAELSYLKAQINPHFLFNTLNSIYSLAIVKSDYAASSIVRLSGMMRYVLSETNEKFVSLEKEMNYIDSYIDLQKMRLGETALVNYSFNGDISNKMIAPLLLIPFIENAFKHGVNPEEP